MIITDVYNEVIALLVPLSFEISCFLPQKAMPLPFEIILLKP